MIDEAATITEFGYGGDVGKSKPVIAICPGCGNPRTTAKQNADRMCRDCAGHHQDHNLINTFKRRYAGAPI